MTLDAAGPDVFAVTLPARPYPGLRPFGKDEWPIFFGREQMIDDVVGRLVGQRLLVVHGDSGCGKSSLIRPACCRGWSRTRRAAGGDGSRG